MTPTSLAALVRHMRKITKPSAASVSDAELLERFVHRRDEAAFELLVWRHQRLVLGVCCRVLGDVHDVEDAFQATFLALARKAAAVSQGDAVASWLYTVAFRIALRVRAATQRTKTNVDLAEVASRADATEEAERRDLAAVLDEEISRLPRKYRVAVVLCYLEGKTNAEAAQQLGVAAGTLAGRLMRARDLLRKRLLRRGIGISGAFLGLVLGEQASFAAAPAALVNTTIRTAASLRLGETAASAISSTVAALAEGALRSLVVSKLKIGVVALLAGFLVTGMGLLIPAALVSPPIVDETAPPAAPSSERKGKSVRVDDYGDPLPDGVLRRLGTLRFRHGGSIDNLHLTADDKTLISSDWGVAQRVSVWELASGKLLRQFPGVYQQGTIALSADGKLLAISHNKTIGVWDVVSGKEIRRFDLPVVCGLAFSPDGKTLASISETQADSIHFWDLTAGKRSARWKIDPPRAARLAFTPDGKILIVGSYDSKIGLWDVATGKKRKDLDAKEGSVFSMALSPDGTTLAAGSRKDGILFWDVMTGKLVRTLRIKDGKGCGGVAFSPDGKTLAAIVADGKNEVFLCLRDVASGKELRRFDKLRRIKVQDSGPSTVHFSRDGKTLIVGCNGGEIRLLDAAADKEVGPAANTPGQVGHVTLSRDGRTLAYLRQNEIRFWDMTADRESDALDTGRPGAVSLALAPDGKTVAAGIGEAAINLWDVESRKLLHRLQGDKKESPSAFWAYAVAFSPDGRLLATTNYQDAFLRLWDVASGKQTRRLTVNDPNTSVNRWIAGYRVAFSPDGELLAASGRSWLGGAKVRIWETATGKELPHLTEAMNRVGGEETRSDADDPFFRKMIYPQVVFSADGRMLARNGRPKTIAVWETTTGRQRLLLKGHEESTVCIAFAPDGRTLASASWDDTIRLWDLDTGRELRKLIGHRGKANSLAFSADGKILVSAGDDTTLLFWDVADITGRKRPPMGRLAAGNWQVLWEDLAKDDAAKAYAAMVRMASGGSTTIAALKERLRPVRPVDAERLARLFKGLDSEEFAVRESANRELERLGDAVQPALRQTLARPGLSLELRRRLEALSSSLDEISGERLRPLRAIEVLEMLGTAEARELLKAMAGGAPGALATTAAQLTLKRLQR